MASNRDRSGANDGTSGLTRRSLLRWGATAGGIALAGSGIGQALAAGGKKTLTIGNIGWTENIALSHLTKIVLEEEFGYNVNIMHKSADDLFAGVADGSIDTFQDVWLPETHRPYWKQYSDQVELLPPWYEGRATLGLTVPNYVEAESISDLSIYGGQFDHTIVGIEPSAGEMRIVKNKVMPGYNLNNYSLMSGSTQNMLNTLDAAVDSHEPIVVTLWKPHWAFNVYDIRYLADPKGLISLSDRLYTIVRTGLHSEHPEAYAFLNAISLGPLQLGQLELAILAADSPEEGVRNWLQGNRAFGSNTSVNSRLVESWVSKARNMAKAPS